MKDELLTLIRTRTGHFLLESGHHGDVWMDLELLCQRPDRIRPFAKELAGRLKPYHVEAACGPLVGGAFVGLMVAEELGVTFTYAERSLEAGQNDLFPVVYRLPSVLQDRVRGKRVAIVNDVINAGSAVRGTYFDLKQHEAVPVVVATLLTLGDTARSLADSWGIGLEALAMQPNSIWTPDKCPMCDQGIPLEALED